MHCQRGPAADDVPIELWTAESLAGPLSRTAPSLNVKVQGLLNAAKWIEEEYGAAALQAVLRECSVGVRERCSFAIPLSWHPVEELVELLTVAERKLGQEDGKLAEAIGAAGAHSNMKGVLVRFARYLVGSEYLTRRIAGMWRQFNDDGEMRVISDTDANVVLEMVGIKQPHWLFCCTLTGWCREVSLAMGARQPIVRHVQCRTRGDERCVYDIRRLTGLGVA